MKTHRLLVVSVCLMLAACQGKTPIASMELQKIPREFSSISRCVLVDLVQTKDGIQTRDAEFERINRGMVWRFSVKGGALRSERTGPGRPTVVKIPILQVSRNGLVAEGPTPAVLGSQRVQIKISRDTNAGGKIRVLQRRTWVMLDKSVTLALPFDKTVTFVDTWTLHCKAERKSAQRNSSQPGGLR